MIESEFGINNEEPLIVFSNSNERSTGFYEYLNKAEESYIFKLDGSQIHVSNLDDHQVIDCTEMGEIDLISLVLDIIKKHDGVVNIDVSVLNRIGLLYLLNMSDKIEKYESLRLLYSEPEDYDTEDQQNPTIGIKKISSIPSYVNKSPLNKPLMLILMLGFEPARSLAIYNNIDPDETYLIVPSPSYKEGWVERTEQKNSELMTTVKEGNVEYMHSLDADKFVDQFDRFIERSGIDMDEWNCRISPLSTKPQSLGLFEYWRKNRGDFALIYSEPLKRKKLFRPVGISIDDRYELKEPTY